MTDEGTTKVYHWVMTVQLRQDGRGAVGFATREGTYNAIPGSSRQKAYHEISELVGNAVGSNQFTVLYFSMENDKL